MNNAIYFILQHDKTFLSSSSGLDSIICNDSITQSGVENQ